MPTYDICYMNDDGSLACSLTAMCRDDLHAKVLAHAMKLSVCKKFEVWQGRKLIYERPQYFGEAMINLSGSPMPSSPPQHPLA